MNSLSSHRCISLTGLAVGAFGIMGSLVLTSGPAGAQPNVPDDVWIQCTGFSGPNTSWPHFLTGCSSRSGTGQGQTNRTAPGTETITFAAPFEGGKSLQLTNISSSYVAGPTRDNPTAPPSPNCPPDHPTEFDVSGTIGPRQPYAGSPVTATICTNAEGFILANDSLFVIHKVPGSPGEVNPPTAS
jgi:hypothetical protein